MYKALVFVAAVAGCIPVWSAAAPVIANMPLSIQRQIFGSGEQSGGGRSRLSP